MTKAPLATNEFPDGLNPVLIKDVRQGLRSRRFTTILLLVLAAMVFTNAPLILEQEEGIIHKRWDAWGAIAIGLMLLVPMGGLGALRMEIRSGGLELLLLSGLSPWRIAMGKWLALVLEAGLISCAIAPFLIIRYFLGGMNLSQELYTLLCCFIGGCLFCAVAVGVSGYLDTLLGWVIAGCAGAMGQPYLFIVVALSLTLPWWLSLPIFLISALGLSALGLHFAATRIMAIRIGRYRTTRPPAFWEKWLRLLPGRGDV